MVADTDRFCADPLADAVLWWVAESGSAVTEGRCRALEDRFAEHLQPAPTLYRGQGLDRPLAPGDTWKVDLSLGRWAAFTDDPDYARLWADTSDEHPAAIIELHGARGVSLVGLLASHAGFAGSEDAYFEGNLHQRIGREREWLVGPDDFTVTAVTRDPDGTTRVALSPSEPSHASATIRTG